MLSKAGAVGVCAASDGVLDTASPSSGAEKMMDCPGFNNDCAGADETAAIVPATINHHLKFEKLESIFGLL